MTGGVIVTEESDEVGGTLLMICTITVPRNPVRRNGRSQRCRGRWFIGGATDRRFVGMVVTAAAENSLPATPIDPFPEPAW
jgi:hypothetical protein